QRRGGHRRDRTRPSRHPSRQRYEHDGRRHGQDDQDRHARRRQRGPVATRRGGRGERGRDDDGARRRLQDGVRPDPPANASAVFRVARGFPRLGGVGSSFAPPAHAGGDQDEGGAGAAAGALGSPGTPVSTVKTLWSSSRHSVNCFSADPVRRSWWPSTSTNRGATSPSTETASSFNAASCRAFSWACCIPDWRAMYPPSMAMSPAARPPCESLPLMMMPPSMAAPPRIFLSIDSRLILSRAACSS